jgi:vacuolar-type H+-ATPase subunit H
MDRARVKAVEVVNEGKKRSNELITDARKKADTLLGDAEKILNDARSKSTGDSSRKA